MLSSERIHIVQDYLSHLKLSAEVNDEILDHYLSEIEVQMVGGETFDQAFEGIKQGFSVGEIKQVNKNKQHLEIMGRLRVWAFPMVASVVFVLGMGQSGVIQDGSWMSPIESSGITKISSAFGMRVHPIYKTKKMHSGVDIVAKAGTPVKSVAAGKVVNIEMSSKGHGNAITVDHGNGQQTYYAQLQEILVKEGVEVKASDIIGTVGSSGASTAPHLHFEYIKEGKKLDPAQQLTFLKNSDRLE